MKNKTPSWLGQIIQQWLLLSIAFSAVLSSTVIADVSLPSLFSDNMILQQQTNNAIWGKAAPGEKITLTTSWGAKSSTKASAEGKWQLFIKTPSYGSNHQIKINANNEIILNNVAIGEVWLCAGQSNMGWSVANSFAGPAEIKTANYPNLRIYKSARDHWHQPLDDSRDLLAKWAPATPMTVARTSAVSYFFAKKLHLALDVPVGIIVQAYAGTPIEGWLPQEIQKDNLQTTALIAGLNKVSKRFPAEQALTNYQQAYQDYRVKINRGETMKNKVKELTPPMITKPANLGHQYPGHIFNAMINPVRPYGIRGAIWYQGERNSKTAPQALQYQQQLTQLISYYRSSWHQLSNGNVTDDFPFFFTQLPSWGASQIQPVEGIAATWAINREMMRQVALNVPNTGMAVSIDTGDAVALHPKNKKPIGIRHAYLALAQVYGKKLTAHGPKFTKQTIKNNKITLHFDSVGSGLISANLAPLGGFAIAAADKKWHWASAKIIGNTVEVHSSEVNNPIAVRYAWAMNPSKQNLLYNIEGLPASPFRTDNWLLFDDKKEQAVKVDKPNKPKGYQSSDWSRPKMSQ